jgi:predicted ester cyclase
MSAQQSMDVVRSLFDLMNSQASLEGFDKITAPDYVGHMPATPPLDAPGMVAFGSAFFAAIPDLKHDLLDVFASEDGNVGARLRLHGTHTADFMTPNGVIPARGSAIDFEAADLFRVKDGRIQEQWVFFDMLTVMQQLGAIPS